MYGLLLLSPLGPGMRPTVEKLGDQFSPVQKIAKGFKSETFLADDTTGDYGSLTLWKSKEDIGAFQKAASAHLTKALSGIAKGPPSIRVYDVYQPKSRGSNVKFSVRGEITKIPYKF
jgi:heme-degrading monooxygenase HmoA